MHSFNTPLTCSQCGAHDHYRTFVGPDGQGIRCLDCLHEHLVLSHQTKRHKKPFKIRMNEAWQMMTHKKEF